MITLHEVSEVDSKSLNLNIIEEEKIVEGKRWYRTLPINELSPGEKKKYKIKDKEILLINQGQVFAIENNCPHMDLPLDIGQVTNNDTILCPYHNSEFCFKSGEVRKWIGRLPDSKSKDCKPLKTLNVSEEEEYIWIQDS